MPINNTAQSPIDERLNQVREVLAKEAYTNHDLLEAHKKPVPEKLALAELFLLTYQSGGGDQSTAVSVAVALELLELAVEQHYGNGSGLKTQSSNSQESMGLASRASANLALITGDYFYARAIELVTPLQKPQVVKLMVQAIARIAVAESILGQTPGNSQALAERQASLSQTAVSLGHLLAESQPHNVEGGV